MNNSDENNKQSDEFIKEVETAFLWVSKIITLVLFVIGLSILVYQLWGYFVSNGWQPVSVISMLSYFNIDWASSPDGFLLVHTLLDLIPLSLFFFLLAVVQYLSGIVFIKKIKKALKAAGVKTTNV